MLFVRINDQLINIEKSYGLKKEGKNIIKVIFNNNNNNVQFVFDNENKRDEVFEDINQAIKYKSNYVKLD